MSGDCGTDTPGIKEPFPEPADHDEALAVLEREGIERVHAGVFDLDGMFREQRLAPNQIRRAFDGEYSFCNVLYRWDSSESVFADPPYVDEDIRLDPTTLRRYPFEQNSALLIGDYSGPSRALSPRELLKAQIANAEALGLAVVAAMEFEFIVLDESAQSIREKGFDDLSPYALDNRCWSGTSAANNADFITSLETMARSLGIRLDKLGMELGPGCIEATLGPRDALAAAEDAALFKVFTKAFCRRRGLTASFMAQLADHLPGLSGHVHLSLVDRETGDRVFHDPGADLAMSGRLRAFVGGLVTLMPECLALCTHTVNAYRRMVPGNWAPRTPTWGPRNYTTAVRVVANRPETTRIEFRVPAADTNPFLAIAMCLGTGLWGLENDTDPPPAIEGDARDVVPDGLAALPRDLADATDRLDQSERARRCFSEAFIDHFVRSRRREIEAAHRHVSAFERARYIEVV